MNDEQRKRFLAEVVGEQAVKDALSELAADQADQGAREQICHVFAEALARTGKLLWIQGAMFGSDRAEGRSPFDFGSDDVVGLATVCQVGGELARGAIDLFGADNHYGASALIRQIVEVEYLAAAFSEKDEIAAEWMRADREERRSFWSPGKLRERSAGQFLREDYWDHCDRGGHPTREALSLLPDHDQLPAAFLWADLAGHLFSIWSSVVQALDIRRDNIAESVRSVLPEVEQAISEWLDADKLTLVLRAMHQDRRSAHEGS